MLNTRLSDWVVRNGKWIELENGFRHMPLDSAGKPCRRARAELLYFLPGRGSQRLEFNAKAVSDEMDELVLMVDNLWFGFSHWQHHEPYCCESGIAVAWGTEFHPQPGKTYRLAVRGDAQALTFAVDGAAVLTYQRPRSRPYRSVGFRTWGKTTFTDIAIETGEKIPAPPARPPAPGFIVSAAIDFFDDIMAAPFTPAMVQAMMERLRELGIRRIYWIASGRWMPQLQTDPEWRNKFEQARGKDDNFVKTVLQGWKWFQTAAQAAHAAGMEAYVFLKPFDLAPPLRLPSGEALRYRKDHCFLLDHPEMIMARRKLEAEVARDNVPGRSGVSPREKRGPGEAGSALEIVLYER